MGGLLAATVGALCNAGGIAQTLLGVGTGASSGAGAKTGTGVPPPLPPQQQTPPHVPHTRTSILSGNRALQWLKDHGYLGNEGSFTRKFHDWYDRLPGDPSRSPFKGIAWGGEKQPNTDTLAIIVEEQVQATPPQPQPPQHAPQGQKQPQSPPPGPSQPPPPPKPPRKPHVYKPPVGETPPKPPEPRKPPVTQHVEPPAEPKPQDKPQKPPEFDPAKIKKTLSNIMDQIIKDKTREGYFVRNPETAENFVDRYHLPFWKPHAWLIDMARKAWNNTFERAFDYVANYKGGQCGEFAKWGMDWCREDIKKKFGKDAIVTDILCISRLTKFWNHGATRVILPNGEKYVLDFWEGMQNGKPAVYKEKDWIAKWNEKFFGHGDVDLSLAEKTLKNYIKQFNEDKGKEWFLNHEKDKNAARILIKAWEKNPW